MLSLIETSLRIREIATCTTGHVLHNEDTATHHHFLRLYPFFFKTWETNRKKESELCHHLTHSRTCCICQDHQLGQTYFCSVDSRYRRLLVGLCCVQSKLVNQDRRVSFFKIPGNTFVHDQFRHLQALVSETVALFPKGHHITPIDLKKKKQQEKFSEIKADLDKHFLMTPLATYPRWPLGR